MPRFHTTAEGNIPFTPEEEAQWDAIAANADAELRRKAHIDRRAKEYPSIGDQLDALFHAGVFPADMAATIQAVKDKYPKG
jgi:hypothetical protein